MLPNSDIIVNLGLYNLKNYYSNYYSNCLGMINLKSLRLMFAAVDSNILILHKCEYGRLFVCKEKLQDPSYIRHCFPFVNGDS